MKTYLDILDGESTPVMRFCCWKLFEQHSRLWVNLMAKPPEAYFDNDIITQCPYCQAPICFAARDFENRREQ